MADKYLIAGATDVSLNASWNPVNVPVAGDNIFIVEGSQVVNAGLGTLAAVNIARFFQSSGFRGSLGIPGTPFQMNNVTSLEVDGGGGQHYINPNGTVTAARIRGSQGGKFWFNAGTWTDLTNFRAEVEMGASVGAITRGRNKGGKIVIQPGTAGTQFDVEKGIVELHRSFATGHVTKGGTLVTLDAAGFTTLLKIINGYVGYQSSGTIVKLEGDGGKLSTAGTKYTFAITNADLHEDFALDDGGEVAYITWTNTPKYYGFKGKVA